MITSVGISVASNIMKNIISSVVEKASISEICNRIMMKMKVCFREVGSIIR